MRRFNQFNHSLTEDSLSDSEGEEEEEELLVEEAFDSDSESDSGSDTGDTDSNSNISEVLSEDDIFESEKEPSYDLTLVDSALTVEFENINNMTFEHVVEQLGTSQRTQHQPIGIEFDDKDDYNVDGYLHIERIRKLVIKLGNF